MNTLPMTAAGYSVLERELKRRIQLDRPRLIERLQEAIADDSNLAENPEYQAVKSEQEINEARIAELEDKLARAEVIDVSKLSGDTVKFGATVSLIEEDTGEHKVWQIVGEPEADALEGSISVTSPIARALIGKSKGETVEVETPGGAKVYQIRKVEWRGDAGIDELELRAFKLAHANGPLRQSTMDAICTALAALVQQASAYPFRASLSEARLRGN